MMRGTAVAGGQQRRATWNTFAGIPCQVDGRKGHLTRFCGNSVAGGRREETPDTLLREFRARWAAGKDTWNTFAGIPCQVGGRKGHLERFRGNSVAGGQRGDATWNTFAGIPWQVDGGKGYLERFRGKTVAGGRRGDATWNAFAGIPWQVGGGKGDLERFCGKTVAGGQRERLPETLSRGFRARWAAEKDTWHAFAGIPCQVGSKRCYLTRFCGDTLLLCQMENFIGI